MARTSTKQSARARSSMSPSQLRKKITTGYANLLRDVQAFGQLVSGYCQATATTGTITGKTGSGGNAQKGAKAHRGRTPKATANRRGRPRKNQAPEKALTAGQMPQFE